MTEAERRRVFDLAKLQILATVGDWKSTNRLLAAVKGEEAIAGPAADADVDADAEGEPLDDEDGEPVDLAGLEAEAAMEEQEARAADASEEDLEAEEAAEAGGATAAS